MGISIRIWAHLTCSYCVGRKKKTFSKEKIYIFFQIENVRNPNLVAYPLFCLDSTSRDLFLFLLCAHSERKGSKLGSSE